MFCYDSLHPVVLQALKDLNKENWTSRFCAADSNEGCLGYPTSPRYHSSPACPTYGPCKMKVKNLLTSISFILRDTVFTRYQSMRGTKLI